MHSLHFPELFLPVFKTAEWPGAVIWDELSLTLATLWASCALVPPSAGQDINALFLFQRLRRMAGAGGLQNLREKGLFWGPLGTCFCGCCRAPSGTLPTWRSCRARGEYCSSQLQTLHCVPAIPPGLCRGHLQALRMILPLSHMVTSHQQLCGEISPTSESENNKTCHC